MLLIQNRRDQVLEHGPAILNAYVKLVGKGIGLHADEANDIMSLVRCKVSPLDESESHLIDAVND